MCIIGLATLSGNSLGAQDISGDWQGTLKAGKDRRLILQIAKRDLSCGVLPKRRTPR
jgi:hypothetical protein